MSQWRFFLHLSILQTYGRKHLSKRKFRLRLRLQVSNNFGSTGSGLRLRHRNIAFNYRQGYEKTWIRIRVKILSSIRIRIYRTRIQKIGHNDPEPFKYGITGTERNERFYFLNLNNRVLPLPVPFFNASCFVLLSPKYLVE